MADPYASWGQFPKLPQRAVTLSWRNEGFPVVAGEVRDDSLEALDRVWEEEQVNFLQAEQQDRCPSMPGGPGKAREETPVPLHWTDFKQDGQAALAQEVRNV